MKQEIDKVFEQIRSTWRFRWVVWPVALVIALVGWAVVFALPDRYEADARVFVDTRSALKPALQGLTTDQNVDAQINYVRQALLEGPQLERIAQGTGILPATPIDERTRASLLDTFSNRVSMIMLSAGNQGDERSTAGTIYSFHYTDVDRQRGLRVVKMLLDTFVEQTLGGKREGSEQAQQFLAAQIKDYDQRLSSAEDKLATFKKTNVGLMPSDQGGYFGQLQTEMDAAKKAETDLSIALSRRDELSRQLHGDAVISAAGASSSASGVRGATGGSDTLSRIQEAQAKLDELRLKFTDKHPDVAAAAATLGELKQRRVVELESLKRGDASAVASSGAGNNPVYQTIQLELNKQDVEIAALRRELGQHQATVSDLRQRLNSAPQVEADFQQLNRDYDVNKAQYTALLESYQKARLGERADNAGSVRFEVVLPPTVSAVPVWPRRNMMLASIFLAAIAAGIGCAFVMHLLKPVIGSQHAINLITPFPVIGTVGIAFPTKTRRAFRRSVYGYSLVAVCFVVAFVAVLVLNKTGIRLNSYAIRGLIKS